MTATDPIFAAIEAHAAAWSEYSATLDQTAGARFLSKKEARRHAARDEYRAASDRLTAVQIQSAEGVAAFLAYLAPYTTPGNGQRCLDGLQWWNVADALNSVRTALLRLSAKPEPLRLVA